MCALRAWKKHLQQAQSNSNVTLDGFSHAEGVYHNFTIGYTYNIPYYLHLLLGTSWVSHFGEGELAPYS